MGDRLRDTKPHNGLADDDHPEEACGVFGVYAPGQDVSRLTYFGLHALQHRGQESAGIAVADGESTVVFKDMGLVPQVFDESKLAALQGHVAVGHVRYSTTGSTRWENAQPILKVIEGGTIALVHNGNLLNSKELRDEVMTNGHRLRSTSDSELIAEAVAARKTDSIEAAVAATMKRLHGAYSLLIMTETQLIGIRDAYGVRPLSIGRLGDGWVLASETCALDIVGAEYERDVRPGELVIIDENGLRSIQALEPQKPSLCVFEFIYFARPDSKVFGESLYKSRQRMGMELAKEAPVHADLVMGLPDSGTPAAIGFARESGIPFGEGLIKNRYIGRTFIEPNQTLRELGVRLKLNPLRDVIEGKRLVVIDDSIVRGNTSRQIIGLLKEAGAKEVHVRISSPPVKCPCFYGIDTDSESQLIAAQKDIEETREFIGADSLQYLSFDGLVRATGRTRGDFCLACFDGKYPIRLLDEQHMGKLALEPQVAKK